MFLLGYDIGSSSIKASIVDVETGRTLVSDQSPAGELDIQSPKNGWAEQDPGTWWKHLQLVTKRILQKDNIRAEGIEAIGISYQMHGLVVVDENQNVLRPSIIWCDGRAVDIGKEALNDLGRDYCLRHLLNSPGNFTASKLKWVKKHEPGIFKKIHKFMLPGDYIGMKLTGEIRTTVSGLSEGILWDYEAGGLSSRLLEYHDIPKSLVPETLPNFGNHGKLSAEAADRLGLKKGIKLTYRAGDQPNNALSLNVMNPGEVASTAGTSGVIYGVTDKPLHDEQSRVNTFLHVNHKEKQSRYCVLLCVNGTGIQNSWLKSRMFHDKLDYDTMNKKAMQAPVGADGLVVIPFGNGPERIFRDRNVGAQILGVNFNRHTAGHVIRAAHEGIAFSLNYGLLIMKDMGIDIDKIRAGASNMYLSPVFREALSNTSGLPIELYETDGSQGAAIGAGIGAEIFHDREEAFKGLKSLVTVHPDSDLQKEYRQSYEAWKLKLDELLSR